MIVDMSGDTRAIYDIAQNKTALRRGGNTYNLEPAPPRKIRFSAIKSQLFLYIASNVYERGFRFIYGLLVQ